MWRNSKVSPPGCVGVHYLTSVPAPQPYLLLILPKISFYVYPLSLFYFWCRFFLSEEAYVGRSTPACTLLHKTSSCRTDYTCPEANEHPSSAMQREATSFLMGWMGPWAYPFMPFFFLSFIFYWSMASWQCCDSRQQRDSAMHIHISILSQAPLPSRLPQNTAQSSLCYAIGPCWLSILNITLYTCHFPWW